MAARTFHKQKAFKKYVRLSSATEGTKVGPRWVYNYLIQLHDVEFENPIDKAVDTPIFSTSFLDGYAQQKKEHRQKVVKGSDAGAQYNATVLWYVGLRSQ